MRIKVKRKEVKLGQLFSYTTNGELNKIALNMKSENMPYLHLHKYSVKPIETWIHEDTEVWIDVEFHPTIHVETVTVIDPDTGEQVTVEIRKDKVSGAMVGLDGSYLEHGGIVYDPYNTDCILDIPDNE